MKNLVGQKVNLTELDANDNDGRPVKISGVFNVEDRDVNNFGSPFYVLCREHGDLGNDTCVFTVDTMILEHSQLSTDLQAVAEVFRMTREETETDYAKRDKLSGTVAVAKIRALDEVVGSICAAVFKPDDVRREAFKTACGF